MLSVLGWIVLGLIAGFIASRLVNKRGEGMLLDLVLGIVGAIAGGWLFHLFGSAGVLFGSAGVTGFNLWSLMVAVVGAVLLLFIWHTLRGPITHA